MTTTPSQNEQTPPQDSKDVPTGATTTTEPTTVVAAPGRYYRNTRYLMTVLLIGMGLWFGYDGFVGWPKANENWEQLDQKRSAADKRNDHSEAERLREEQSKFKHHTDTDIRTQKMLAFALPPLAIILLIWALHNSRGEYRLEGTMLHVPGHPPVPFANITEIDKRLWDRKGIAYVSYDLGNGQQGSLKLDDFLYDRPPTDEIYGRIEKYVQPQAEATPATTPVEDQPKQSD